MDIYSKNKRIKNLVPHVFSILTVAICFNASAQTIYVDELIQDRITQEILNNPNHPYNQAAAATCSGALVTKTVCLAKTKNGLVPPEIKNINLVDSGTNYSNIKDAAIPESIDVEYYSIKNCTQSDKNINEDITIVYNESESIRILNTISTKSDSSINASVKIDNLFSFGGNASYSQSIDLTKETNTSNNITRTVNESLSEDIAPYTALIYTIKKSYSNAYIDFDGQLSVDAELYSPQGKHVGMLSDFFDDEPITVKGQIWNVSSKSVEKEFIGIPLPSNYIECSDFDIDL